MKFNDFNDTRTRLQTVNKCLRAQPPIGPASSNGKPVVSSTTTNNNDRFAILLPTAIDFAVRFTLKPTVVPVSICWF